MSEFDRYIDYDDPEYSRRGRFHSMSTLHLRETIEHLEELVEELQNDNSNLRRDLKELEDQLEVAEADLAKAKEALIPVIDHSAPTPAFDLSWQNAWDQHLEMMGDFDEWQEF